MAPGVRKEVDAILVAILDLWKEMLEFTIL